MTSFPVFRKQGITPKRSVLELWLPGNTDRKSGTGFQNHYSLLCRTPSCGEIVMTSFPVFRNLGITPKRSFSEQKLEWSTNRKHRLMVWNHITSQIRPYLMKITQWRRFLFAFNWLWKTSGSHFTVCLWWWPESTKTCYRWLFHNHRCGRKTANISVKNYKV